MTPRSPLRPYLRDWAALLGMLAILAVIAFDGLLRGGAQ